MFVYVGTENEMPDFRKIVNIFIKDDEALFLTSNQIQIQTLLS